MRINCLKFIVVISFVLFSCDIFSQDANQEEKFISKDTIWKGKGITFTKYLYYPNTKNYKKVVKVKYYSYKKCVLNSDDVCKSLIIITNYDIDGKEVSAYKRKGEAGSWGYRKEKCYKKNINSDIFEPCLCSEVPPSS